jgi:hypothetical protein
MAHAKAVVKKRAATTAKRDIVAVDRCRGVLSWELR